MVQVLERPGRSEALFHSEINERATVERGISKHKVRVPCTYYGSTLHTVFVLSYRTRMPYVAINILLYNKNYKKYLNYGILIPDKPFFKKFILS